MRDFLVSFLAYILVSEARIQARAEPDVSMHTQ